MWTMLATAATATAGANGGVTLGTAIITALAGLVGALAGGALTSHLTAGRERTARVVESQRQALHDVQDAALTRGFHRLALSGPCL